MVRRRLCSRGQVPWSRMYCKMSISSMAWICCCCSRLPRVSSLSDPPGGAWLGLGSTGLAATGGLGWWPGLGLGGLGSAPCSESGPSPLHPREAVGEVLGRACCNRNKVPGHCRAPQGTVPPPPCHTPPLAWPSRRPTPARPWGGTEGQAFSFHVAPQPGIRESWPLTASSAEWLLGDPTLDKPASQVTFLALQEVNSCHIRSSCSGPRSLFHPLTTPWGCSAPTCPV